MFDIIIVGGGPAGLTAAIYAGRTKRKVLILEAQAVGGQILKANKIENYPGIDSISGFDYANILYNQVTKLGVEIKYESVIRIEDDLKVITNNNTYQAKAIILATGAENKKLNIEKERDFVGKGISYCATCDGAFFKKKNVAVLGEDKEALEDALYLSDIVEFVYCILRKDVEKENRVLFDELKQKENIKLIENSNIKRIIGDNKLESIVLENDETIPIDGLFIAIGHSPKNEIFKNIVELDENGYIVSTDGVHTKHEKIYVAGDTRQKELRQLTTAVGDGALASTIALKEMED